MSFPVHAIPPHSEGGFSYLRSPVALLGIAAVVLIVIALCMPSPIAGIDSGLKWLGAKSFSESSTIAIPPVPNAVFAQDEFPPCPQPFLTWNRNELYPVFPVLPMILNGLTMHISGQSLWWFWSVLPVILLFALVLAIAKQLQLNLLFTSVLLFFATPLTVYAVTYWEHALGAVFACGGLWLLLHKRFEWSLFGALLLGLAPWIRIELLGWSALGFVFAYKKVPLLRWSVAGIVIVIGLASGALLNNIFTGSWLPLQIVTNFQTGQTLLSELKDGAIPYRTYFAVFFGAGKSGWTIALMLLIAIGIVGWRKNRIYSVLLMLVPAVYVLSRLFEPLPVFGMLRANGLLYTMPVVLIAPWGWKRLPDNRIWGAAVIGLLLAVLAMGGILDGIHWSVRFLLPLAVPLTIAAMIALCERPLSIPFTSFGLLGIVAMTVYGVVWYANIESRQIQLTDALQTDAAIIATDVAWVGGDAAPLLREREVVFLQGIERIGRFILTLKQNHIESFQYIRMPIDAPLTKTREGNWSQLVALIGGRFAPTPEQGRFYRIEKYRLLDDSVAIAQLAGELAARNFSRGDEGGIKDARTALKYNPNDYRPAVELLAFGIETRNRDLVIEQLNHFQTHPLPEKYKTLVESAVKMLNAK